MDIGNINFVLEGGHRDARFVWVHKPSSVGMLFGCVAGSSSFLPQMVHYRAEGRFPPHCAHIHCLVSINVHQVLDVNRYNFLSTSLVTRPSMSGTIWSGCPSAAIAFFSAWILPDVISRMLKGQVALLVLV